MTSKSRRLLTVPPCGVLELGDGQILGRLGGDCGREREPLLPQCLHLAGQALLKDRFPIGGDLEADGASQGKAEVVGDDDAELVETPPGSSSAHSSSHDACRRKGVGHVPSGIPARR